MLLNIGVSVAAGIILLIVGIIWNKTLGKYESKELPEVRTTKKSYTVCSFLSIISMICSVSFPNTDDSISEALDYIKPYDCLSDIMESLK